MTSIRNATTRREGILTYVVTQYRRQARNAYLAAAALILLAALGWLGVADWISSVGSVVLGVIGLAAGVFARQANRMADGAEWAAENFGFTEGALLTANHVQLPSGEVSGAMVLSEGARSVVLDMPVFGRPRELHEAVPLDPVA